MIGTRRLVLVGSVSVAFSHAAEGKRRKKAKHRKARKTKKKPASTAIDHDAILSDLASRVRYGLRDDELSVAALEKRLADGETVECQCTNHSMLAARAIQRAGGRARVVGSFLYPFNEGPNTGHVMMEVRVDGQWHCYDVMCNVQAVDANGQGCSLEAWCASSEPRWRRIADDEAVYPREEHLAAIYDRLLGTPWVAVSDSPLRAVFYDPDPDDAALIMKTYKWLDKVNQSEWNRAMS